MELEPVEPCYTYDDVPVIFIDFFFYWLFGVGLCGLRKWLLRPDGSCFFILNRIGCHLERSITHTQTQNERKPVERSCQITGRLRWWSLMGHLLSLGTC